MKNILFSLLFPPKCAGCGTLLEFQGFSKAPSALCKACQAHWNEEQLLECDFCGKPVTECRCLTPALQKAKCQGFQKLVYYCHGTRNAVQNRMIYQLKERKNPALTDFFCTSLLAQLQKDCADSGTAFEDFVIVYLPRGKKAILETGNDQAKELAKGLSEKTGFSLVPAIKRKSSASKAQKELNKTQRKKNARSAYFLSKSVNLHGKTVLLVDDIVTTGESMAACIKLLYSAGAKEVRAIAVASDDINRSKPIVQPTFRIE